jgi:hypothetical protein
VNTYRRRCGHVLDTASEVTGKSLVYASLQPCPACLAARVNHRPTCLHCGRASERDSALRCDNCGASLTSIIVQD